MQRSQTNSDNRGAVFLYNLILTVAPLILAVVIIVLIMELLGNLGVSFWLLPLAVVAMLLLLAYEASPARRLIYVGRKAALQQQGSTAKTLLDVSRGGTILGSDFIRSAKAELYSLRPSFMLCIAVAACLFVHGLMLMTLDRLQHYLLVFAGFTLDFADSFWLGLFWLVIGLLFLIIPYNVYNRLMQRIRIVRRDQVTHLIGRNRLGED